MLFPAYNGTPTVWAKANQCFCDLKAAEQMAAKSRAVCLSAWPLTESSCSLLTDLDHAGRSYKYHTNYTFYFVLYFVA